jgi:hypothetical protein
MGLAFAPSVPGMERPSWSYSGFHGFRCRLAAEIGVYLEAMEMFCTAEPVATRGARADVRPIPWSKVSDPLVPLLAHSDCEGVLTPAECARVAPRLRDVVPRLGDEYDTEHGLRLAALMEWCAAEGVDLEFC